MTQLKQPFIEAAKFRQKTGKANLTPKSVEGGEVAKILAKKDGIGKTTMQDALTVDKSGTPEQKKSVINGKATPAKPATRAIPTPGTPGATKAVPATPAEPAKK